ncbi:hypothetical protein O0I10_003079 [Lichtheimia ornata]|uniref:Uncharacterized protein n=1 Tax=Lichtheimia ornata TaxID=688661 RepID=A0AAD7V8D3_9FUNG|nr:uncharacterized protein O0I10_003079 [Lichtheimia ornata]KAJ8661329.1 hypothetical protein O0I10_003079 [Lichtheimia ornata]
MKHKWRLRHKLPHIDLKYVLVYLLRTHPEILVDRKNNPDPWNRVQQHQNIKFINAKPDFYAARKNMERPSHYSYRPLS